MFNAQQNNFKTSSTSSHIIVKVQNPSTIESNIHKKSSILITGDLLCRNATHPRANINEAKEYFHRAIQNGRQIESHQKLALIYKEENNFSKAIEMLEHSLQYKS